MKSGEIILNITALSADPSLSLDERIDSILNIMETHQDSNEIAIEGFKIIIDSIKQEKAVATHIAIMLQSYAQLAELYASCEIYRPLEKVSFEVREILRDDRIAWELIAETLPVIIDALEETVYNHELYRLLLVFLDKAYRNNELTKELKGRVRHFLKLHILLNEKQNWTNHMLTKELQEGMASLFSQSELMKIIIKPTIGHLRRDPVEYTLKWEEIYYDVEEYLDNRFANAPRQMGFCFMYWSAKREYLKENYDIDWHSPAQMNPGVRFD